MWIRIIIIATVVSAVSLASAHAQEDALEKDPFYPSADRPAVVLRPSGADEGPWGRDPFNNPLSGRTQAQKGQPSPGQRRGLSGIIYSKGVRLAIFGGETYQEGGKVGDRKLVDIRRRSVVFMSASGEKEEVFLEDFTMSR